MEKTLGKGEYERFRGGQSAALRLTAVLWLLVFTCLFALRFALDSGRPILIALVASIVFVLIGWCQASLNNGFHEAVHENVGEPHSDWLSLFLLGLPTFFTLQYRTVHLRHHLKVGDPKEDPDFATYGRFPRSRWQMIFRLLYMGSGMAAAKQLLSKNLRSGAGAAGRQSPRKQHIPVRDLLGLFAVQVLLLLGFNLLFGVDQGTLLYLCFWILPLGMIAKLAKSTRAFCEHGSPRHAYVLRTITGSAWQTGTLGMYGFHYHGEHHLYPWVAYSRLGELHDRLRDGLAVDPSTRDGIYEHFEGGYFKLLSDWFWALPWRVRGREESSEQGPPPQVRA